MIALSKVTLCWSSRVEYVHHCRVQYRYIHWWLLSPRLHYVDPAAWSTYIIAVYSIGTYGLMIALPKATLCWSSRVEYVHHCRVQYRYIRIDDCSPQGYIMFIQPRGVLTSLPCTVYVYMVNSRCTFVIVEYLGNKISLLLLETWLIVCGVYFRHRSFCLSCNLEPVAIIDVVPHNLDICMALSGSCFIWPLTWWNKNKYKQNTIIVCGW